MELWLGTESTWSIRAWLCAQIAKVPVEICVIDLNSDAGKQQLATKSPTALVPLLIEGDLCLHDSFAIAEYLNEISDGALLPTDQQARARARSLCAEMHSGFSHVREQLPLTFSGAKPVAINSDIHRELDRLSDIFFQARQPFYYETPSMVDAFYSVLAVRLSQYGIHLSGLSGHYQQSLLQWPLLQQSIQQAKRWSRNQID